MTWAGERPIAVLFRMFFLHTDITAASIAAEIKVSPEAIQRVRDGETIRMEDRVKIARWLWKKGSN